MSVVFALATPPAKSAICVYRVSGDGCLDSLEGLFGSKDFSPRMFHLADMKNGEQLVDRVGLIVFKGPNSYTGEDSFEVYAHGSLGVMSLVSDAFINIGFSEASPGEFTKRAFLNNKISLNEAESLSDLIDSTSSSEVFLSGSSLFGDLSGRLAEYSDRVNSIRMRVEAEIDFSDEDEDFMDDELFFDLCKVKEDFESFVSLCANKRDVSQKKNILLVGPTNSGKSSIFNRLVGYERAIVTNQPGTTRDMISSEAFFEKSVFSISDTAGMRKTDDVIEEKGIEMSLSHISEVDLVLGVFENYEKNIMSFLKKTCKSNKFISVQNKTDINEADVKRYDCCVSAKTGDGFKELRQKISNCFSVSDTRNEMGFMVRDRHVKIFVSVTENLEQAIQGLSNKKTLELVAEDLKNARSELDELIGKKFSDSLLGDIFSSFCIGK